MSTTNLSFGDALTALKSGHKVARSGWNGKGMYIVLSENKSSHWVHTGIGKQGKYLQKVSTDKPYIIMGTAEGNYQPGWLASQADMLSEDWQIIKGGNS